MLSHEVTGMCPCCRQRFSLLVFLISFEKDRITFFFVHSDVYACSYDGIASMASLEYYGKRVATPM